MSLFPQRTVDCSEVWVSDFPGLPCFCHPVHLHLLLLLLVPNVKRLAGAPAWQLKSSAALSSYRMGAACKHVAQPKRLKGGSKNKSGTWKNLLKSFIEAVESFYFWRVSMSGHAQLDSQGTGSKLDTEKICQCPTPDDQSRNLWSLVVNLDQRPTRPTHSQSGSKNHWTGHLLLPNSMFYKTIIG